MKYVKKFNEATDLSQWKFDGIQKIIRTHLSDNLNKMFTVKISSNIKTSAQIAGKFDIIIRKINNFPNTNNKKYTSFKYEEVKDTIDSLKEILQDKYTINDITRTRGNGSATISMKDLNKEDGTKDNLRDLFLKSSMDKLTITFNRIGKIEQQEISADLDIREIFIDIIEADIYVKAAVSLGTYDIGLTFKNDRKYPKSLYDDITSAIDKCMLYDLELNKIRISYKNPEPYYNKNGIYNTERGPGILTKSFKSIEEWDSFDKSDLHAQYIKIVFSL